MAISDRLTKLSEDITSAYKSINDLGGTIPAHKNTENISVAIDSIYNRLPKVSGTGSDITLTPTLKGRLGSVINGDTYQQTYTGKNLINAPEPNNLYLCTLSVQNNSFTLTATSNGNSYVYYDIVLSASTSYKLTYTASASGGVPAYYIVNFDSNNNQTNLSNYTTSNNCNYSFTTPSDTKKVRIYIYCNFSGSSGNSSTYNNLMVSTSGGDYEPYVGGQASPNPDYPQDIQCVEGIQNISVYGKNLLDINNPMFVNTSLQNNGNAVGTSSVSNVSQYIKVKPNTQYTLSLTNDSYSRRICFYTEPNASENPTISHFISFIDYSGNSKIFTTPANCNWLRIGYYNGSTDIQLELGTTPTTYEAYTGNTYEVNLEGKNLFDGVVAQGEFYSSGNINTSTTIRNYSVNYIPVKPSTQYVSNYNLNRVCFYDENKTFISRSSSYNFKTFTTLSNAYYIRFDISIDYDTNTLQLEKGNTSTPYVPYRSPIKLYNGDYITGTPDNWSVVHNSVESIIDGTLNITYESDTSTPTQRTVFRADIKNNATTSQYLSNRFIQGSTTSNRLVMSGYRPYISLDNTITGINTSDTSTEKINKLKTWLSTHNVSIVFPLATPTTTPITDTNLISQLNALYNAKSYNGQTNISVSGNLPMIIEASALKGE